MTSWVERVGFSVAHQSVRMLRRKRRFGLACEAYPPRRCVLTTQRSTVPHSSFRHEAFFYKDEADFVAGLVPFVHEGVALGQPVMIAVTNPRLALLRTALSDDASSVYFVDMAQLGRNPARIIPGWRTFVDEHSGDGRPVRGVGEPIWEGRRAAEVAEAQLHEALLNLVVDPDTPLWLRCPYHLGALDDGTVDEATRSHPALVEGGGYRGSRTYGGAPHARDLFEGTLPEPTATTDRRGFGLRQLPATRRWVGRHAQRAGITEGRVDDLMVAVSEVASNSVRHGGGTGSIRVWRSCDALICEVTDDGQVDDLLVGRQQPTLTQVGGRGVWLANQLCDLVQLRSGAHGTTVRISTWTSN